MRRKQCRIYKMEMETAVVKWPEECYTCEANKICLKCAGILNAECGSLERVTEEFCRKYKEFMEDNKEVQ